MQAWQHRWETWAGWNLGLERWDFAFGAGQAKRLSRSDHALSDSATKLAAGTRPTGTPFVRGVAQFSPFTRVPGGPGVSYHLSRLICDHNRRDAAMLLPEPAASL
jgi:hypothetical protein